MDGEEYTIHDEKDEDEVCADKIEHIYRQMKESERKSRLARQAISTIDGVIGILMQTRSCLNMDASVADCVADTLDEITDLSREIVDIMNKEIDKKKKKRVKDGI